jgi:hypothetical protein
MRRTIITKSKDKPHQQYKYEVCEGLDLLTNSVTITADLNKRSVNMNKFYRLICKLIAQEEGRHIDAIHFDLKCLFLEVVNGESMLKTEIKFSDYGRMPTSSDLIPTTTTLSKEDFKDFWQRCAKLGNALHNMQLPMNPNEMSEEQYIKYLESTI